MNKIELNKDTIKYFHFTTTKALESIDEKGLLALIGDNSRGVEKTHKVFFSESLENAARCLDVWVRWRIVHFQKTNARQEYLNKALKDFVPQEELVVDDKGEKHLSPADAKRYSDLYFDAELQFTKDIGNGRLITQDARAYAYEDMFRDWQAKSYLALDLEEGLDFDKNGLDEALEEWTPPEIIAQMPEGKEKEMAIAINKKSEYMYGGIDTNKGLQAWNMHTHPGQDIPRDKILGQLSVDGKTDGLSIARGIYKLALEENPELDLPDLKKWLSYCKTREQDNQHEYEWDLKPDGNHKLKIFGTEQDKEIVDAYLTKNVDKIWDLSKNGGNPNIPVTYLEFGDRPFPEKGQEKFGVVKETTLPVLSQLIVRDKSVKNPNSKIGFINDCLDCGARFISAGNQYVMPEDCLEQISSPEVKEHVEEISSIAKESEQEYIESGKKLTTNNLHNYIQQNIQGHIQGQALQTEGN